MPFNPSGLSAASASGSLAVTGGPQAAFVPTTTGFSIEITEDGTTYKFLGDSIGATTADAFQLGITHYGSSQTLYYGTLSDRSLRTCATCSGLAYESGSASVPFNLNLPTSTFNTVTGGGTVSISGSLTGQGPTGTAYSLADMPRSTNGSVSVGGSPVSVWKSRVTLPTTAGGITDVALFLTDGSHILAIGTGAMTNAGLNRYVSGGSVFQSCSTNCGFSLAETPEGFTVAFNAATVVGTSTTGPTVSGNVFVAKTTGSLKGSFTNFTPGSSSVMSTNDIRTLKFDATQQSFMRVISLRSR